MATTLNISGLPLQAGVNAAPAKGLPAGPGGLLAFLNLLLGQAGDAQSAPGGGDLAAKLAAILKSNPGDKTQLTALLQKLFPEAGADQLQQAVAQIQAAPAPAPASGIQPALTSDLSASFAANLQTDGGVMAQLKAKFDALAQGGPITPDRLAQFRRGAIDTLKTQGLDAFSIDKALVSLTADLGDKLTTSLAVQLSMPVPAQAAAAAPPAPPGDTAKDNSISSLNATAPAAGDAAAPGGIASGTDAGVQQPAAADQAAEQADTAASTVSTTLTASTTAASPADGKLPASGLETATENSTTAAGITAPPSLPDVSVAASKPLPSAAAHIFVMNRAQDNGSFANTDSGQQMFQGSAGSSISLSGMMHGTAEAGPQGFVNYMNSSTAQATQATQQVAVQIAQNANNGVTTFTMQLEPAELGRLEVRMKFGRDGGIKAHLIADKPETLSMLRQDQAQIHRILSEAGLNADDASLSFDLRQQGQQQGADQSYNGAGQSATSSAAATASDYLSAKISVEAMGYIRQNGVNIMV